MSVFNACLDHTTEATLTEIISWDIIILISVTLSAIMQKYWVSSSELLWDSVGSSLKGPHDPDLLLHITEVLNPLSPALAQS